VVVLTWDIEFGWKSIFQVSPLFEIERFLQIFELHYPRFNESQNLSDATTAQTAS